MVWVHGGGYVAGTVEGYVAFASRLSEALRGAVILPDYRLAPEHPFPAGLEDVTDAITATVQVDGSLLVGGDLCGLFTS
jgi:acetyl esterase